MRIRINLFLGLLALLPVACAHRQVATLTTIDLDRDGCAESEVVAVNVGALPDGTGTLTIGIGGESDQRRFSEQFRPIEGTDCKAVFTVEWGDQMAWDSMDLSVEGSGWDKWFHQEVHVSPSARTAEVCLDDAWGRHDMELQIMAYVSRQGEGGRQEHESASFRIPPYSADYFQKQRLSIHFTQMVTLAPWSPEGEPSVSETETFPVDFTFTAQASPGTWQELDPNWHFSWEDPKCLAKKKATKSSQ